jgi:MFS family permease
MLTANSAAILTDAFPSDQRGLALGVNQIAAIAGQFIGLIAGGLLAALDWRAVFWVNVPVGVFGALWAYRKLRDTGERHPGRIDWWGNITFAVGLSAILIAVTSGIQPYGGHTMGWTNPAVYGSLIGGTALLAVFIAIEAKVAEPMIQLGLFKIRAFAAGNLAGLLASIARGGLQFMLIIWLQGIWLPLHGYDFESTPLWAGIYLLPLTTAFLVSGPLAGVLSDRFGARGFATAGMLVFGASFVGLTLLPLDFPYPVFALLIVVNGLGVGMFSAPNSSSIMGRSRPPSAAPPRASARPSRTRARRSRSACSSR